MTRLILFFALFLPQMLSAQGFEPVFPALAGQELRDSVVAHYKPVTVLNYAMARDTLYARVLGADDDSIRCIYSGHTLYLDPTQDPTQYIYLGGSTLGMNTEHAYPQGKGAADGNARSDMHHLFPARIPVNEARGDLPFNDITDVQTEKWFYKTQILYNVPALNKDFYSEYKQNVAFEPRESVKGDLARAIFYFYTMYKDQADLADPNFFELQRPTLCQWNELDPADSAELVKTWRIAPYQEGKANPFILDCTLAFRVYCPQTPPGCSTGTQGKTQGPLLQGRLVPQPFSGKGWLEINLPFAGELNVVASDAMGRVLGTLHTDHLPAGQCRIPVEWPVSGSGVGSLQLRFGDSGNLISQTLPVLWVN